MDTNPPPGAAAAPVRVPCVGGVAIDQQGRLLLVRRGRPPAAGRWSLPGGRVEPGESEAAALAREVLEETGLVVDIGPLVGRADWPAGAGVLYAIADYAVRPIGGTLAAGDDAAAARWFTRADLDGLALTDGLVETLTAWGVLAAG